MPSDIPDLKDLLAESIAERRQSLKLITLSCPQCGVFFKPTREWQRFCSTRCRQLANKAIRAEAVLRQQNELEVLRQENAILRQSLNLQKD